MGMRYKSKRMISEMECALPCWIVLIMWYPWPVVYTLAAGNTHVCQDITIIDENEFLECVTYITSTKSVI